MDLSTGIVVRDPLEAFAGLRNDPWEITEEPPEPGSPGTVRVETSIVSQMARYLQPRPLRTNVESHESMLDRAGLSTTDTFFKRVALLVNKPVFWGMKAPAQRGRAGPGGTIKDKDT